MDSACSVSKRVLYGATFFFRYFNVVPVSVTGDAREPRPERSPCERVLFVRFDRECFLISQSFVAV